MVSGAPESGSCCTRLAGLTTVEKMTASTAKGYGRGHKMDRAGNGSTKLSTNVGCYFYLFLQCSFFYEVRFTKSIF